MYSALTDFVVWPGLAELAQVATPEGSAQVVTDLLRARMLGESVAAWTAIEIAVADACIARINDARQAACDQIDGSVAVRHTLPLPTPQPLLRDIERKLARYRLHAHLRVQNPGSDQGQHPIHLDYDDALRILKDLREGRLSLGASDPSPPQSSQAAEYASQPTVWGRTHRPVL